MKRALVAAGVALAAAGATVAVYLGWRRYMDVRSQGLANLLAPNLAPRLARWAPGVCYGALRTVPGDFSGDAAGLDSLAAFDAPSAWALLGFAVIDHESNGGDGKGYSPVGAWEGFGDGGRAVTPWQLDWRYHGRFYKSGQWRDPAAASEYAFGLLAQRWRYFAAVPAPVRISATLAAYNASEERVAAAVAAGADPDETTTGGNYSADVLRRLETITGAAFAAA